MASIFQFSIRSLLVAVTVAAVGIAALLNANVWWEGAVWTIALALLGGGILLSIYRRGQQRAYWLGFVIFGCVYALVLPAAAIVGRYHDLAPSRLSQIAYESIISDARRTEYLSPGGPIPAGSPAVAYSYTAILTTPSPLGPADPLQPPTAVYSTPYASTGTPPVLMPASGAPWTPNPSFVSPAAFSSVAHSLWLLLAAVIGGKACQWIYRTRPAGADSSTTRSVNEG